MNYHYMQVFYTVGKYQNISKAANELGVSQPAVSRIISSIEKEYQTRLFIRSKNGVTLTSEGLTLFNLIKQPFVDLEKIDASLTKHHDLNISTIHIGATATALKCFLFRYMDVFQKNFPSINIRIYTGSSKKLLDMVSKGSVDLAFITTPFQIGDDLESYNILSLNNILVAPMKYKDMLSKEKSIHDSVEFPFILLSNEMQFREHIDDFFNKNGVKIIPTYETDSSSLLLSFVENGLGLTFIPEEMAKESIEKNRCFKVDLKETVPPRYISFVIKKNKNHADVIYRIKKYFSRMSE